MNHDLRVVASLVAQALEPVGRVRPEETDFLHITLPRGTSLRVRVAPWTGAIPIDAFEGNGTAASPPLWVVKRSTPQERQAFRDRGDSFVSLDGAVRILAPGVLIDRTDLEVPASPKKRPPRSAFSDRASNVARELFEAGPEQGWTVSSLAEASGVSRSVASYAIRDLEYRNIISVKQVGNQRHIRLNDRRGLVEEWSRDYDWRDNHILPVHTSVESVRRFLFRLRGEISDIRWAVTLHAAASLLATRAPVENIHIYLDVDSEGGLWHLARNLGWKHAEDGNLRLIFPHYRTSVWKVISEVQGVPLVSSLQLILDLWHHPNMGRDVAETLLDANM